MSNPSGDNRDAAPKQGTASGGWGVEQGEAIRSAALMNGRREVTIVHAGERYRLRITANDKLILTK